jgi:hypothetical protein
MLGGAGHSDPHHAMACHHGHRSNMVHGRGSHPLSRRTGAGLHHDSAALHILSQLLEASSHDPYAKAPGIGGNDVREKMAAMASRGCLRLVEPRQSGETPAH